MICAPPQAKEYYPLLTCEECKRTLYFGPASAPHLLQPNNITYAECATRYPSAWTNPLQWKSRTKCDMVSFFHATKRARWTFFCTLLPLVDQCSLVMQPQKYTTLYIIYTVLLYILATRQHTNTEQFYLF